MFFEHSFFGAGFILPLSFGRTYSKEKGRKKKGKKKGQEGASSALL